MPQLSRNDIVSQQAAADRWVLETPVCRMASEALMAGTTGALLSIALFPGVPLHHDCAAFLGCSRLLLQGAIPYVDYMNQQPPICDYLHALPVSIASVLGLPISMVFHVVVLALALYSTCSVAIMLSKPPTVFSFPARLFLSATWPFFSIIVLARSGFGQREHLFLLAYLPWFFCREARYRGMLALGALPLVAGLIAGPFILLKPHFCVLVVVVEAWMLGQTRKFDALLAPELFAVAGWAAAFAVHFMFVPSSMLEAIFHRWVPFIFANYDTYNGSISLMLRGLISPRAWVLPFPGLIGVAGLAVGLGTIAAQRLQLQGLSVAALIAAFMYILQGKGWDYHFFPALGLALMVLTVMVAVALDGTWRSHCMLNTNGRSPFRVILFCLVCLFSFSATVYETIKCFEAYQKRDQTGDFVDLILSNSRHDDRVGFISSSVFPAYPSLILADRLPGIRYTTCSVMIPFVYKGVLPDRGKPFPYRSENLWPLEERRFLEEIGDDMLKYRPKL